MSEVGNYFLLPLNLFIFPIKYENLIQNCKNKFKST